ncbi:MAG: 3-deoxy-D-manno-octulosonic-acid transferase [Verrucomicrobiaceae bacterium]|nr:3-deoxy-D-manno-octulosonic-acid transferase [Verrucomicrobiaceae bacterium]
MPSRRLSLTLYNALLPLGLLFMAPAALVKMRRRQGRWQDFGQRFGFFDTAKRGALASLPIDNRLWMHAVSVGEVGVARKLIAALLKHSPERGIVLTTTTPTGYRLAEEIEQAFPGRVVALYSPLDLRPVARRMLDQLQPRHIVLVEAEIWPNLLSEATKAGIPVTLVNARLSPRSERKYLRFRNIIAPIFQMLRHVCVQEPEDVARWAALGVDPERIILTGSVKYDPQGSAPDAEQVQRFEALLSSTSLSGRPLLLAGSTHAGEEKEMAKIYQELKVKHPTLGFLIVPRHYERGPEVQAELLSLGLTSQLRSNYSPGRTNILIIDSTGELKAWQELATIVIIGKSFLAEGGQNPAEAVMAGKPVVFGPHMENFIPLVNLLLASNGALQVGGLDELSLALDHLLTNSTQREDLASAGRAALMHHDGATNRTVQVIANKNPPP